MKKSTIKFKTVSQKCTYVFAKYFDLSPLTPCVDADAVWAVGAEHDAGDAEH